MGKPVEIKVKSVSFNVKDATQRKLYERVCESSNVSAYIKHLITQDLFGGNQSSSAPVFESSTEPSVDLDDMGSVL